MTKEELDALLDEYHIFPVPCSSEPTSNVERETTGRVEKAN